jgi:Tol biopolymer transport system component
LPDAGLTWATEIRLVMFNSDGTNVITLVSNQLDLDIVQPSTSRDGTKVAFRAYPANTSNPDRLNGLALYVVNSDGTGLAKLASNLFHPGTIEASPDISGDGSKIVFTAVVQNQSPVSVLVPDPNAEKAIFIINSDGTGLKELAQNSYDPGNNWKYPQISDDGSKVVFSAYSNDSYKIFVVNPDATGLRQIAQSPTKIKDYEGYMNPTIDGDGSKVAFNSYIDKSSVGFQSIFIVNSNGTGLEQITSNIGIFPSISGDGKKIVYTWQDGIYIVQLTADNTLSANPTTNPTTTSFPTPTVPEFSWLVILPLFSSLLLIAIKLRRNSIVNKGDKIYERC